MQAIEWCHFRWPWVTPDPGLKDTVVLKGEYIQSDAFYRQLLYRTLVGNHRQAIDRQASYRPTAYNPTAFRWTVQSFRKRRAGLSATAGLSCLLEHHSTQDTSPLATCNCVCVVFKALFLLTMSCSILRLLAKKWRNRRIHVEVFGI